MEALEAPAPSYKIVLVPALMLINGLNGAKARMVLILWLTLRP